jgi:MinD-like ATPase involved in chromosome partitioning or flagellar assembly
VKEAIRSQTPLLTRHPSSTAGHDVDRIAETILQGRPGR